jgi:PBP1b-binding outer membrane lipoprotein LpoB
MLKRMITIGLLSLLWVACANKDEDQAARPAAEAPAEPITPEPAVQDEPTPVEEGDPDEVPTDSDFEEEASADITVENLETELSRLEQEIGE